MDQLLRAAGQWPFWCSLILPLLVFYLFQINRLLSGTPDTVRRLSPARWTKEMLFETYKRLEKRPITIDTYVDQLPPKLDRRYIVTGGSGLVGGHIVLQLLARGQHPASIRIVDFQKPHRHDMLDGPASDVDFVQTDISSSESTDRAFSKAWHPSVAHLPLTVFHTAAIITPSDRSKLVYGFCEAVNVRGTQHVVSAARRSGADILVSTTSGSISIRPVEYWVQPWKLWSSWPRNFFQILDETDFFEPLRPHEDFYANYPVSKAVAERIVCEANTADFRTGCIRPANGVYGNPTDNTVGSALQSATMFPQWTDHIVQSFVHGANAAIAHLLFEAVLTSPDSSSRPQAGRPFTVTDPNPPITYGDLYYALSLLAITGFRTLRLPPMLLLLPSYIVEWYTLLLARFKVARVLLPSAKGDIQHLKPALFSITTHLVATNAAASRPVEQGGLGYRGVLTSMDGMVQEVVEWNREHMDSSKPRKTYRTSVSFADDIQRLSSAATSVGALQLRD
ncbi:NAD(P)-binding protein [Coniochaeta ligniaria NRRL 30616]|uniref:NAD(P)-binding protein n=1 Tax=Coniochaeta ligniaria NRRL 30616 TaxID=1408157 RepID=A0A1J7IT87_9PEZI|nr:NAD(P)-binding protein [Coniochaeta ligniaria NRRL 30616]